MFSGELVFRTYPSAPYFMALRIYSESLKVVNNSILIVLNCSFILLVACTPSIIGILISMSTISGFSAMQLLTASSPFAAVPTTRKSSSASRIIFKPSRIKASSSTIRIFKIHAPLHYPAMQRGDYKQ